MSRNRCPQCGIEFKRLPTHWRHSPGCSYPRTPDAVLDILYGLLSVRGSVNPRSGDRYPRIHVFSRWRDRLEALQPVFGVYSGSIGDMSGESMFNGVLVERQVYRMGFSPVPEIKKIPDYRDYEPSRLFYKAAFHLAGHVRERPGRRDVFRLEISRRRLKAEPLIEKVIPGKTVRERSGEGMHEAEQVIFQIPVHEIDDILEMGWPSGWWNDHLVGENVSLKTNRGETE